MQILHMLREVFELEEFALAEEAVVGLVTEFAFSHITLKGLDTSRRPLGFPYNDSKTSQISFHALRSTLRHQSMGFLSLASQTP